MFFRNGVPFGNGLKISESFSVRRPWWSDRNDVICIPWFRTGKYQVLFQVSCGTQWFCVVICTDNDWTLLVLHCPGDLKDLGPGVKCTEWSKDAKASTFTCYCNNTVNAVFSQDVCIYTCIYSLCDKVRGFFVIVSKCNFPNHRNSSSIVPTFVQPIGMSSGPRR